MEVLQEKTGDLSATLTVKLDQSDYQPKVEEALKRYRKRVDMKGFRKGHVPVGVVKKMYGNQIMAEELNMLVQDQMRSYMTENDLRIIGDPIPKEDERLVIDINNPTDFEFVFEVGLQPEVDLSLLSKDSKITEYKIKIEDKFLDEELDNLRNRLGDHEHPESIEDGDLLAVEFEELNDEGDLLEGGFVSSNAVPISQLKDEFKEKAMKFKLGDSLDLPIFDAFDKEVDFIRKHILQVEDEDKEIGSNFRMTLKNITRNIPAEMNEEFFKKAFGEDAGITDEEGARKKISDGIAEYFVQHTEQRFRNEAYLWLLENVNLDLPEEFLKRWMRTAGEKELSAEEVEAQFEDFTKSLKWSLIENKIMEQNDLKVGQEEIVGETQKTIMQYMNMPADMIEPEMMNQWVDSMLKNEQHVRQTQRKLVEEKVFTKVRELVTVEAEEITLEEFNKKD